MYSYGDDFSYEIDGDFENFTCITTININEEEYIIAENEFGQKKVFLIEDEDEDLISELDEEDEDYVLDIYERQDMLDNSFYEHDDDDILSDDTDEDDDFKDFITEDFEEEEDSEIDDIEIDDIFDELFDE